MYRKNNVTHIFRLNDLFQDSLFFTKKVFIRGSEKCSSVEVKSVHPWQ